jgi:hypothetical protein
MVSRYGSAMAVPAPFRNVRRASLGVFVIVGLLGEGVASSARFDPQAKSLGEWLRSRYVEIPAVLLDDAAESA